MRAMASNVFDLFEQVSSSFSSQNGEGSDRDEHDDSSIEDLAEMLRTASLGIGNFVGTSPPAGSLPQSPQKIPARPNGPQKKWQPTRSSATQSMKIRGLQRGPMPILKTRIPRDLQAVFLASQRGETVHEPPRSGAAFREFKRGAKSKKEVVFDVQLPPVESRTPLDTPPRRTCRWGALDPSDPNAAMPRQPKRASRVVFTFFPSVPSLSASSSETSPALPKRSASPILGRLRDPIRNDSAVIERLATAECCQEAAGAAWPVESSMSLRCSIQCIMTGTTNRCSWTQRHLQPRLPQRSRSPECPAGRNPEVGVSTSQ
jgi:hypothetical protein